MREEFISSSIIARHEEEQSIASLPLFSFLSARREKYKRGSSLRRRRDIENRQKR